MREIYFYLLMGSLLQACGAIDIPRTEGVFASLPGVVSNLPPVNPANPTQPTTPTTPVVPSTPVSGTTCRSSDPNKLCMGIRMVVFKNSAGTPVTNLSAVEGTILNVNRIWSSCNIGFQVDQFDAVDPVAYQLPYEISNSSSLLTQFTNIFHAANFIAVGISGPWHDNMAGWSYMSTGPNQNLGLVLNPSHVTVQNTLAHELGHYIGLDHVGDPNNIMALFDNRGTQLPNQTQCQFVRSNIPVSLAGTLRR